MTGVSYTAANVQRVQLYMTNLSCSETAITATQSHQLYIVECRGHNEYHEHLDIFQN